MDYQAVRRRPLSKLKKNVLNISFLLLLFTLTLWLIFRDQDLGPILRTLRSVPAGYIIIGLVLVVLYVCGESVIIKYLLRAVNQTAPLINCIRYSFVGFFFSCITPSATGGQPAQIYYMQKQGINIPTATIILMLVTIQYKFVLVFIGLGLVLFGQGLVQTLTVEAQFYLYLGLGLNVFCVTFMSFLVFLPDTAKFLITKGFLFLQKLHLMRNKNNRMERLQASMDRYREASVFLKEHKLAIFNTTVITFVQRILLFFVTYVVYRSFGLAGESVVTITLLQSAISISVDMLPLPGGMGISERLFLQIFAPVFGSTALTLSGMLMSRGISYYMLIVISAIITCVTHLTVTSVKSGVEIDKE